MFATCQLETSLCSDLQFLANHTLVRLNIISHQKVFADFENIWFWSDGTSESFRGLLALDFVPLV